MPARAKAAPKQSSPPETSLEVAARVLSAGGAQVETSAPAAIAARVLSAGDDSFHLVVVESEAAAKPCVLLASARGWGSRH